MIKEYTLNEVYSYGPRRAMELGRAIYFSKGFHTIRVDPDGRVSISYQTDVFFPEGSQYGGALPPDGWKSCD